MTVYTEVVYTVEIVIKGVGVSGANCVGTAVEFDAVRDEMDVMGIISVVTMPIRAGQSVIVDPQLVIVYVVVKYSVDWVNDIAEVAEAAVEFQFGFKGPTGMAVPGNGVEVALVEEEAKTVLKVELI